MVHGEICCIRSVAEAEMALAAGAAAAMRGRAMTMLLTAETAPGAVSAHVARCGTAAVQLVDRVPEATVARLRADHPGLTVIRVVHVGGPEAEALAAARGADMRLPESGVPAAGVLGGTGRVHDRAVSARIVAQSPVPVWLAGGLGPANAAEAAARVRPHGLDIGSGLRPQGDPDAGLLAAFMASVR